MNYNRGQSLEVPRGGGRPSGFRDRVQVFEPHRSSLPPLAPYLRESWQRRAFAYELSRTTLKSGHFDSPLGALWLVLNPLLLAVVYYLLVAVIGGGAGATTFLHILIGLFTWYYVQNCMMLGAQSVTGGGRLILNQSFPRVLLPASSVISAFMQFLPTLPVYVALYTLFQLAGKTGGTGGLTWNLLWEPVVLAILTMTGFGLALIFGVMAVYFRDTSKFLSYVVRIWLYLSPVLYSVQTLEEKAKHLWPVLIYGNPLGPILGVNSEIWIQGVHPSKTLLLASVTWAVLLVLVGGWLFISRERDFAIRL